MRHRHTSPSRATVTFYRHALSSCVFVTHHHHVFSSCTSPITYETNKTFLVGPQHKFLQILHLLFKKKNLNIRYLIYPPPFYRSLSSKNEISCKLGSFLNYSESFSSKCHITGLVQTKKTSTYLSSL